MKTGSKGIELIKRWEGFKANAYLCPAGVWTIGYGHTGGVKSGDVVTKAEAEAYLRADLAVAEQAVSGKLLLISQNQFDALVSFVFNVGTGNFNGSTLLRLGRTDVNNPAIRTEFSRWINAGGRILAGLVARRRAEADLYFSK